MTAPPLTGRRVVDLSSGIAGAYCTRLLADGGADVVAVEPAQGNPLRRWSASHAPIDPARDGPLFNYLASTKRSVVVDDTERDRVADLIGASDLVVWSPGPLVDGIDDLQPSRLRSTRPDVTVVTITPFGLETSWSDRSASELTLQACSGGIVRLARNHPDRSPAHVGGQIGQWLAGTFAAIGAVAALRRGGDLVDVSVLESLAMGLTYYPVTFHDFLGRPIRADRFVPTPGVSEARDGTVGLGTGTGQQWLDFCAMVGRDDWAEDPSYFADRTSLAGDIDAWVAERTVEEVLELATAFRLPNAPIANGADVASIDHLVERGAFEPNPRDGATNPRSPFRFRSVPAPTRTAAPSVGDTALDDVAAEWRSGEDRAAPAPGPRGYEGLRVLDMTAFWAGPLTGHLLALLGADVIHVESARRPDGARSVGGVPQSEDHYLERGPIYAALNTDKKSLGVDLSDPRGVDVLKRLLATCDVLIENYTPRVLDHLGLDHDTLAELFPELIVVRMPGFGLDGPWRDKAAFAFVIEDAAGFTWLTGHPDRPPIEPYSIGDPNAGLHAAFALQLAVEHRDRTGEGGLVEVAMVDAALAVTAEQVIEYSAHGALLTRTGNRGPLAAPQNLYRVSGLDEYGVEDRWVAVAVETDDQWAALVDVLGRPAWATDPTLATVQGRRDHHDEIDHHLATWCRSRRGEDVVDALSRAGVPAAEAIQPQRQVDVTPMAERRFFQTVDHAVVGPARYATMPMRFSSLDGADIHRCGAPLLGEHTDELLAGIGFDDDELSELRRAGIVGGVTERDAEGVRT